MRKPEYRWYWEVKFSFSNYWEAAEQLERNEPHYYYDRDEAIKNKWRVEEYREDGDQLRLAKEAIYRSYEIV